MQGNHSISHYTCVEKCQKDFVEIFNRCFKEHKDDNGKQETEGAGDFFQKVSEDLITLWPQIALVCLVAFVFSYILLMLFRYAIKYVIWVIYIGFIVVFAIGAIALWFLFATVKGEEKTTFLVGAIILTVITLLFALVLYLFRKRIALVAELFKEASRSLIDVPGVLFEPILVSRCLRLEKFANKSFYFHPFRRSSR
jgi:hypothetical protein